MKLLKKLALLNLKVFFAFCCAYMIALMGREFISYGLFSFVFLLLSIGLAFFYFIKNYNFITVLLLQVIFVGIAVLLRVYVMISN